MSDLLLPDFISGVKKIQQALHSHKFVIFLGAGISVDSGVPTWSNLIKIMKEEAGIPSTEDDFLKIAQMYHNQRGAKEYNDTVRQVLGYKKVSPNALHHAIIELLPEHIITTNYDDLIEQVVEEEAAAYSFVKQDPDLPYAANSNLVIKMHGDFELLNMVLKEDDYINYEHNFPLINSYVSGLFASRLILFVGFSFADWNLKVILQRIRTILGKDAQPAYLLTDHSYSPVEVQYYRERGVIPLSYTPKVENYLSQRGKLQVVKSLSLKGQSVLNFLTFIREFQPFEEEYGSAHILVQMYKSLNRYEELPFLPPHNLPRIFPFTQAHTHQRYRLDTDKDDKIKDFFECIATDKVVSLPLNAEVMTRSGLDRVDNSSEYLLAVIRKLNNGLIYWINDIRITHNQAVQCNCSRCCYNRLDLAQVFSQTAKHTGFESSLGEKLMNAYMNCQTGNFVDGFYTYKEAAKEAWKAKLYIIYFICLTNIKKLRTFVEYESVDNSDQIIRQIDKIDLNVTLSKISVEDFVKRQILYIIENRFFNEIAYEIDEITQKIQETSDLYENNGSKLGGDAEYAQLQWTISQLHSYYNRNFLYYEDHENFKKLITRAFDGLLKAYGLSPEYQHRLKEFQDYFLVIAVIHCDSELLWRIVGRHNLPAIKIASQASGDTDRSLTSVSINFFRSFHSDFWGPNRQMQAASYVNHFFPRKCARIAANLMTILALIEMECEEFKRIVPHFVLFLEYQTILWADPQMAKSLKFLFHRKITMFTNQQVEKILWISVSEKSNLGDLTKDLCETIGTMTDYQITDEALINFILTKAEEGTSEYWQDAPIAVALIVQPAIRKRCVQIISNSLEKQFDPGMYIHAVEHGLLEPTLYYEQFLSYSLQVACEIIQRAKANEESKHIFSAWHEQYQSKELDNLFYFINQYGLPLTDSRLTDIAQVSDYYQWLLNSENFDYDRFKEEWLERRLTHVYIVRMKNQPKVRELLKEYSKNHLLTKPGRHLARVVLNELID